MNKTKIREVYNGVTFVGLIVIPLFVIFILFDTLKINGAINPSINLYDFISVTFFSLIAVGYILPIIYYIWKKRWLALLGSIVGGLVVIVLLFGLGLFISCSQWVCL